MLNDIKKILIIQFRPIGDVLLCTPMISLLRKHYLQAHIAFMVEPLAGQILENNPDLDEIIYYRHKKNDIPGSLRFFRETGRKKWDLVIDAFGTPGTAWATLFSKASIKVGYDVRVRKYAYTHRVSTQQPERYSALKKLALLKEIGIDDETHELTLCLSEAELEYADEYFKSEQIDTSRLTVCLAPASKRESRAWLPKRWIEFGNLLMEICKANIILLWGPGEDQLKQIIAESMINKPYIIPKTNLREMAAIINKSHCVVSNSSGPGHMAVAVGIPTVIIHGPTTPVTWTYPDSKSHRFVQGDVPCIECNHSECIFPQNDPKFMQCMETVNATDVVNQMKSIPVLNSYFPAELV